MKLTLVHDEHGNIQSVFIPGAEFSEDVRLIPDSGKLLAEVSTDDLDDELAGELSGLRSQEDSERVMSAARRLVERYKVHGPERKLRLKQ